MNALKVSRAANAKINLALHVTGQRRDGYHLVDSLVCFIDIADRLDICVKPENEAQIRLTIDGPFASGLNPSGDNLVVRAAHLLLAQLKKPNTECPPVAIHLEKNLPVASGIGGGSADAAAALVLLKKILVANDDIDLHAIATQLGADVAMCLDNLPKHATGIGEVLSPFPLSCSVPIILVNPLCLVSTPEVFGALQNKIQQPVNTSPDCLDSVEQAVEFLAPLRNDLEPPATTLVPAISTIKQMIKSQQGCLLSRMSGSGATCFGIFDNTGNAANAAKKIKHAHPDWWSVCGTTIPHTDTCDDR